MKNIEPFSLIFTCLSIGLILSVLDLSCKILRGFVLKLEGELWMIEDNFLEAGITDAFVTFLNGIREQAKLIWACYG